MFGALRAAFARLRNTDFEVEGLLPADAILSACDEAGYQDRSPLYTAVATVQMFLKQLLQNDHSCQRAVSGLVAHRAAQGQACSAATGSYCVARQRLPEGVFWNLLRESGRQAEHDAPEEDLWCQRRVRVVDGSTLLIADTPQNRQEYPLQANLNVGCHFPLVRILAVFSLTAGVVLEAALRAYKGKGTGETGMLRDLAPHFAAGDVLLNDRYFAGYWDILWWFARGIDTVTRLPASRRDDFRRGQRLGRHDHLIQWRRTPRPDWLSREAADALPAELTLREIRVRVGVPGFRTRRVTIVTTLLDAERYPASKLSELYRRRWEAELNLRSLKTHLQMEQLRTKTPEMVRKEFTMHLLAYNGVRRVAQAAARASGKRPWRISFKGTQQTLLEFLARLREFPSVTLWWESLLATIAQLEVGDRPDRVEPRAVKRRPKDYPSLTTPRGIYKSRILANT